MAIAFPSSPVADQLFVSNNNTWRWTGSYWVSQTVGVGYTGSTGYSGSVGFTGSTGVGFTGSIGPSGGYAGSAGYTGSTGVGTENISVFLLMGA